MERARKLQLATVAAITLFAATAEAARVVVLEVRGEDDSEFENMLVDAIKGEHDVVESRAFDRAARREGVGDELDARSIAKVARSLEAAAVLDPLLARRDGEWELTIRVRGKDGTVKKKMKVSLDAPRLGSKGKKKVAKELLGVLDEVLTVERGKPKPRVERDDEPDVSADDEVAAPRRGKAKAKAKARVAARDDEDEALDDEAADAADDDENPLPRGKRARVARADDEDDEDAGIDDDLDEAELRPRRRGKGRREIRRAGVLLEAGSSVISRRLTFSSRAFDEAPRGYPGSPVPAAHVAVEVYPLALTSARNPASGIGAFAEYDKVLGLTTRTSQAQDVAMPTRQSRWTVGGKLRYAFGRAPNLPSVTVGFGYGRRVFIVDRSGLPTGAALDLPDVDYRIYEPSFALRVPIGTDRLALTLGARGLLFKSAGRIQKPEEYGAAKLTGVDGEVAIDAAVTGNVLLRLRGSYTTIGYDFAGNGTQTNSRDGNPDTQDVGGASDRWMSAGAALAVVY